MFIQAPSADVMSGTLGPSDILVLSIAYYPIQGKPERVLIEDRSESIECIISIDPR